MVAQIVAELTKLYEQSQLTLRNLGDNPRNATQAAYERGVSDALGLTIRKLKEVK